MKKIFYICLLLFPISLSAQWNIVYNNADLAPGLAVLNQDTVIAISSTYGRIHRSSDGGQSWTSIQTLFSSSWFFDVHFPSTQVGYACGGTAFGLHTNIIAKTTDAGLSWDSLTANSFSGYSFNHIFFVDDNIGFVSGEANLLLKTTDGGANFSPISIPIGENVTAISFQSSSLGFVATQKAIAPGQVAYKIRRTTDLGSSWASVYTDTMSGTNGLIHRTINNFSLINTSIGYAVGGHGLFLKTTNGGQTWGQSLLLPNTNLTGISFTDANTGYINNAGGIYKTENGGLSWMVQNISPLSIIRQISFASKDIGFAVADGGMYKTLNGGQLTGINSGFTGKIVTIFPNPVEDYFSVKSSQGNIDQVRVYNISGKLVKSVIQNYEKIDLSDLTAGVYSISVTIQQEVFFKKLVKQ